MKFSPQSTKLINQAIEWIASKPVAQEGFSALMVSAHPNGTRASRYSFATVEEATEECKRDLTTDLSDATGYVLAIDASMVVEGGIHPVVLLRVEEASGDGAWELVFPYEMRGEGGKRVFVPGDRLYQRGRAEAWLPARP
ncbi:MAG: hypothetical protein HYU77_01140 [Betaproteobacteria bacterium]|nr:hypothetical protein [Betaproteobacteria bacterium]